LVKSFIEQIKFWKLYRLVLKQQKAMRAVMSSQALEVKMKKMNLEAMRAVMSRQALKAEMKKLNLVVMREVKITNLALEATQDLEVTLDPMYPE